MKIKFWKLSTLMCLFIIMECSVSAQSVEVIDTAQLIRIIHEQGNKTKVISFWATWCKPCVQELPYLEDMNISGKADVILVSLDFMEDLDTKVYKFVWEHGLTSRVCLLDNVDYNSWINSVDKTWTGAIPATLLINPVSGKRKFIEKQITKGDLDYLLSEINNQPK